MSQTPPSVTNEISNVTRTSSGDEDLSRCVNTRTNNRAGASKSARATLENSRLGIIAQYPSRPDFEGKPSTLPDSDKPPVDEAYRQRDALLNRAAMLLPNERIAKCQSAIAPGASHFVGLHNPDKKTGSFSNLQVCDSYACPMCAYRRSEEDRHELSIALAQGFKLGLFPVLITCTIRHHMGDRLDDLRAAVGSAFDKTFSGRWYQDLKAAYDIATKVKTWEPTYNTNGHHPHLHILMWMGFELVGSHVLVFEALIKERWGAKLAAVGYDASWEHGISVETASSAIADYISKFGREPISRTWGVDSEMAKAPVKRALSDGFTPFDLLAVADGNVELLERWKLKFGNGDDKQVMLQAGRLYREYFEAFKGKPRIHWGSAKEVLGLEAALEEFSQNNPPEPNNSYALVLIERGANWGVVLAKRLKPSLREVLKTGDVGQVQRWLDENEVVGTVPAHLLNDAPARPEPTPSRTLDIGLPFRQLPAPAPARPPSAAAALADRPPAASPPKQTNLPYFEALRSKFHY